MLTPSSKPIIFLAFANDRAQSGAYLRNLGQEAEQLRDALAPAEQAGLCQVEILASASAESILKRFHDPAHRGRIALFHYAGHAADYDLLLESATGQAVMADGRGLALFLRQQRGLHLVFLNACSTRAQVEGLLDAGVAAVIATARAVDDQVATDFARHFYTALASGDSIRTSFDKAQAALHFVRGDLTRHLHPVTSSQDEHTAAGWPWALYLRAGAEDRGDWNLPSAANDPLFGLPPLPAMDLPAKPFRDLSWFRRADAPIFFGRGQQIRQLYTTVTDAQTAPLVLFYGQSGVGKSSLLDAGLLPRLEQTHQVRYMRREQEQGLLGTLVNNLPGTSADFKNVLAAWRAAEQAANQPLILILDQVEEHFTRPNPALPDEMAQFLAALTAIFADRSQRPQGKLILSFRKEWLAEIEKRLIECELPFSKVFLERLDEAGVIEAVRGVAVTPALHQHYGLTLADGLAADIAHDLLQDREAAVAPMLQILLTRLWEEAKQRNRANPCFGHALYDQLRRDGLRLQEFLDRQLARLREQQADTVDSGLALDLLSYHTTPLGTAEQRDFAALQQAYRHREGILAELVRSFQNLYLLVDPAADQADTMPKSRLAHDTLAPLVRALFDESDLPGQRARRILQTRAGEWDGKDDPANPTPLDHQDLQVVEAGAEGMRVWNEAEQKLIEASRQRIQELEAEKEAARQREEAARQREEQSKRELAAETARREEQQRRAVVLRRFVNGLAVLALVALVATGVALWQRSEANTQRQNAEQQTEIAVTEQTKAEVARDEARRNADAAATSEAAAVAAQQETDRLKEQIRADQLAQTALVVDNQDHLPQRALLLAVAAAKIISPPLPSTLQSLHNLLNRIGGVSYVGHEGEVGSVAFSPDGQWLASSSLDDTVRLWPVDDPTVAPIVLHGDGGAVLSVAFSPDSKWLASGNMDETLRLWQVGDPTAAPIVLRGHEGEVWSVAFSPDGKWLASGSVDSTLQLWPVGDPTAAPIVLRGHEGEVSSVTFSPDSKWLASAGVDYTIRLWPVDDPAVKPIIFWGYGEAVLSVAFSLDGKWLASAGADHTIRLWQVDDLTAVPITVAPIVFRGHEGSVLSVVFSPDGKWLASGSGDHTVRLWPVDEPTADSIVLRGHEGAVLSVVFSPDGKWLASGSGDSTLRSWQVDEPTAQPVVLRGDGGAVLSVVFSPDGKWLASASGDNIVRLWPVGDPTADSIVLRGHEGAVLSVVFSPDGKWLASAGVDSTLRLWPVADPTADSIDSIVLRGHEGSVSSVAFSWDGKWLASAGVDETLRLWQVDDPTAAPIVFRGHEGRVSSVVSSDGKWLASAGTGLIVRLWRVGDPTVAPIDLRGHNRIVSSVAFSPDGKWLASGSEDHTIRLWQVDDPTADSIVFRGHERRVSSVAFSLDGKRLASGSEDGTLRLWQVDDPTADSIALRGHEEAVYSVAFSPDGKWLASGSGDNTVRLWHASLSRAVELACTTAGRNLRVDEWQRYFPEDPYALICSDQPLPPSFLSEVNTLAQRGEITISLTAISQALQLDPNVQIDGSTWNVLCWNGALAGLAAQVMAACENAVTAAPEHGGTRDSRGLARALTGNVEGAIEDFEFFVQWAQGRNTEWREAWIADLKAGKNPFTAEVLQQLRDE